MASRDPWLDNVKMVLVTCVVVGHFWSQLPHDHAVQNRLYDFLYYWHMPAFVLLSGYLSRGFGWDRRHLDSLVTTILVPYLLFEPLLYGYRALIGDDLDPGPLLLDPHWGLWYLAALFFWRLATPVLKRHWLWIPASVAISLASGLLDTTWLALPRVLGMLPFFVIGLHLTPATLDRLRGPSVRLTAVAVLVALLWWAGRTDQWARTWFILWNVGYAEMDASTLDGMRIRLIVIALSCCGIAAVLALVPRRETFLTAGGRGTLVVYLIHLFVIATVGELPGWFGWADDHIGPALALSVVLGVALATALASGPSVRLFMPLVDPVSALRRAGRLPGPPPRTRSPAESP